MLPVAFFILARQVRVLDFISTEDVSKDDKVGRKSRGDMGLKGWPLRPAPQAQLQPLVVDKVSCPKDGAGCSRCW